jgi:hypothetical protein
MNEHFDNGDLRLNITPATPCSDAQANRRSAAAITDRIDRATRRAGDRKKALRLERSSTWTLRKVVNAPYSGFMTGITQGVERNINGIR